jgi:ADP-heptose:LPS heptosyltransferase
MSKDPFGCVLRLFSLLILRPVVILPVHPGQHPRAVRILAFLFRFWGSVVVATRYRHGWYPATKVIDYDTKETYLDNIRRAFMAGDIPTGTLGAPPALRVPANLPAGFPERPTLIIHPFSPMSRKTLPLHRWRALIEKIHAEFPTYDIVLTGAQNNASVAHTLVENLSYVRLALGLPLPEVAGLLTHAVLYVSIDTGISHLAGVLHIPSIILAHRNDPPWLPSYNPNAILLSARTHCTCGNPQTPCEIIEGDERYRRCVYDLTDSEILDAISRALAVFPRKRFQ